MDTSIISLADSFSMPNSSNNNTQQNNIDAPQSSQVSVNQNVLATTPSNLTSSLENLIQPNKRRHDLSFGSNNSPPSKQHKADENRVNSISLSDMVAQNPVVTSPKMIKTNMVRSIYISPFKPTIEPEQIMKFLMSKEDLHQVARNIKCTKLLNNKRKNRVTFVSFKLDVPRHYFSLISDPTLWQINGADEFTITEFIEKSTDGPPKQNQTNTKSNNNLNIQSKNTDVNGTNHRKKNQQRQQKQPQHHRPGQMHQRQQKQPQHFTRQPVPAQTNHSHRSQRNQGSFNPFRRQGMSQNMKELPNHRCYCQERCAESQFSRPTNYRRY